VTTPLSPEALDAASPLHYFTDREVKIDGDVFNLALFPFLAELYDEALTTRAEPGQVVIRKAAQLGLTAWAVLTLIHRARHLYRRGVLYAFPTDDDVYDFVRSRFNRILQENEVFRQLIRDTDSIALKRIGNCYLYFRGARSRSGMLSIPCDAYVLDEFDEMTPEMTALAEERVSASKFQHAIKLGHPSIPGYGIDAEYESSDQRLWLIPCSKCGTETCLEAEFPDCIHERLDERRKVEFYRACRKCGAEIEVEDGQWVASYPDRRKRGYYCSQLLSKRRRLIDVMERYRHVEETGRDLGGGPQSVFWNMVMGQPYAEIDDLLNVPFVLSLCERDPPVNAHVGPCALGADVGKHHIYAALAVRTHRDRLRFLRFAKVESFDDLYDLGAKFHVQTGVVDMMAETRSVRAFCRRAPWAWGCWYSEGQRQSYAWDPKNRSVTVNRTESLDASHSAIVEKRWLWPREHEFFRENVVPQLVNLVRRIVEDPKTGARRAGWFVRGVKNDHFRHAINYCGIAAERVSTGDVRLRSRRKGAYTRGTGGWQAS
jgi:hypothetical protein